MYLPLVPNVDITVYKLLLSNSIRLSGVYIHTHKRTHTHEHNSK